MTRKDYVAVAASINNVYAPLRNAVMDGNTTEQLNATHELTALYKVIDELSATFAADNPRFQQYTFYKACTKWEHVNACKQCGFPTGSHGAGCATQQ